MSKTARDKSNPVTTRIVISACATQGADAVLKGGADDKDDGGETGLQHDGSLRTGRGHQCPTSGSGSRQSPSERTKSRTRSHMRASDAAS